RELALPRSASMSRLLEFTESRLSADAPARRSRGSASSVRRLLAQSSSQQHAVSARMPEIVRARRATEFQIVPRGFSARLAAVSPRIRRCMFTALAITLVAPVACAPAPKRAYDGPERAASELATLVV